MRRTECWAGLVLAGVGAATQALAADQPSWPLELCDLVLAFGVAVLAIGLVRDVGVLLRRGRFRCESCVRPRGTLLICAESVIGAGLVALGLACLLLGLRRPFAVTPGLVAILAGAALFFSGMLKDRVVAVLRREDHRSVIL